MNYINNSHLKMHDLTPASFKEKFPNFKFISDKTFESIVKTRKEKYKLLKNKCLNCKVLIPYEKRRNFFCNSTCSTTYNNSNRKVTYSKEALKKLKEYGIKSAKLNFLNKPVYKKTYYNIVCKICFKESVVDVTKKGNKTCSTDCKKKAHAIFNFKQNKTYAKSGYYQGVYCASSWELAFLIFNKDLGNNIRRCEKYFNYEINEEKHLYFPDFIMDDIIYEIKGRELEDVEIKAQAVRFSGVEIEIFRRKEIMPLIKYVQQMYGIKDITQLYD